MIGKFFNPILEGGGGGCAGEIPIDFNYTGTPNIYNELTFQISAGTYSIVESVWEFGDDVLNYGDNAVHIYNALGTYTAKLFVRDNEGAIGYVEKNITISNIPSNSLVLWAYKQSSAKAAVANSTFFTKSDGTKGYIVVNEDAGIYLYDSIVGTEGINRLAQAGVSFTKGGQYDYEVARRLAVYGSQPIYGNGNGDIVIYDDYTLSSSNSFTGGNVGQTYILNVVGDKLYAGGSNSYRIYDIPTRASLHSLVLSLYAHTNIYPDSNGDVFLTHSSSPQLRKYDSTLTTQLQGVDVGIGFNWSTEGAMIVLPNDDVVVACNTPVSGISCYSNDLQTLKWSTALSGGPAIDMALGPNGVLGVVAYGLYKGFHIIDTTDGSIIVNPTDSGVNYAVTVTYDPVLDWFFYSGYDSGYTYAYSSDGTLQKSYNGGSYRGQCDVLRVFRT